MKKTNNKGFSLVELIIVIAIMAILAGAIAPALIRYIDKSRKSNDVSSCKTIKTAIETALGNEDIYARLVNPTGATIIKVNPGKVTPSASTSDIADPNGALEISGANVYASGENATDEDVYNEIGTNIGEKTPKLKYKKVVKTTESGLSSDVTPACFYAVITTKGTVFVGIGEDGSTPSVASDGTVSDMIEIAPNVNKAYQ